MQFKTKNNADGMKKTLEAMQDLKGGLVFVNLVDFDQLFGHRNDVEGYANALEEFDRWLPDFRRRASSGRPGDSYGGSRLRSNQPLHDHSREYTPLLVFGPHAQAGSIWTARHAQ